MRSVGRSGGWGILVGLVGAACTLPNAAYEGTGADEPTEGSVSTGATEGNGQTTVTAGEDAGTVDGTGEDPPGPCTRDLDCADGTYCNGREICDPEHPEADDDGCVAGPGDPCEPEVSSCDEEQGRCVTNCELDTDVDDDGVASIDCPGGTDCNDQNDDVFPGATEVCDENALDEDCNPESLGDVDGDMDDQISHECCNQSVRGVKCGSDCDDTVFGIGAAGSDWNHCSACDQGCAPLESCFVGGECLPARRVFVTSQQTNGNIGGLEAADSFCQEHAEALALEGTWRAFLVDGTASLTRLEHANVPYVRLDGAQVAASWMDLVDGGIAVPINRDEQRSVIDGPGARAWTGLTTFGDNPTDADCENWTSAAETSCLIEGICGASGDVMSTSALWATQEGGVDCNFAFHLYCIEQLPG